MKHSIALLLSILSIVLICGWGGPSPTVPPASLKAKMERACSDDVAHLTIVYFPEDVEVELGFSPKMLEEKYWSKTVIRRFGDSSFKTNFIAHLKDSDIKKISREVGGVCWGLSFFDKDQKRILTMYFDQFGDGQVDGIPVSSNSRLLELLRSKIAIR